ncbi:MAG: hypothetical protein ACP5PT_02380 [Brevinematia bacterium]
MSSKESSDFEKQIFDLAAKTGSALVNSRTDKTTVENIIPIFQRESDPVTATLLLMAYILRQSGRGEIDRSVSGLLLDDLKNILDNFRDKPEKLREVLQKYLVLVKWVYESKPKSQVARFDDLLKLFIVRRTY